MLKSWLSWLLESVPVPTWVIVIWLFGLAVVASVELRRLFEKASEE